METITEAFFFILTHPGVKERQFESLHLYSPSLCYDVHWFLHYNLVDFWRLWRIWLLSLTTWWLNAVKQCQQCRHNLQLLYWKEKAVWEAPQMSTRHLSLAPASSFQSIQSNFIYTASLTIIIVSRCFHVLHVWRLARPTCSSSFSFPASLPPIINNPCCCWPYLD